MVQTNRLKLPFLLFILQIIFVILFAVLVEYDSTADTKKAKNGTDDGRVATYYASKSIQLAYYMQ